MWVHHVWSDAFVRKPTVNTLRKKNTVGPINAGCYFGLFGETVKIRQFSKKKKKKKKNADATIDHFIMQQTIAFLVVFIRFFSLSLSIRVI